MPDEPIDQTPQDGTVPDQTPQDGTGDQTAAADAPASPPAPISIDYESKWKASQNEALRLYHMNQQMASELQQLKTRPAPAVDTSSDTDYFHELPDAVLDRDYGKLNKAFTGMEERVANKIMAKSQQEAERTRRIGASMSVVNEAFKAPGSALGAEAMQRYQQIMYDPSYTSTVASDMIDVPTPQGVVKLNPHLMRMAVLETQAQHGARLNSAREKLRGEPGFIEPAAAPSQKPTSGAKFDPQKHMTENERQYCQKRGKKYSDWWEFADPKLKAARLKEGKALSSASVR